MNEHNMQNESNEQNVSNVPPEKKYKGFSYAAQAKAAKIVYPMLAILGLMLLVLSVLDIFDLDVPKEAREAKDSLKDLGCRVEIAKTDDEIDDVLDIVDLPHGNINEAIVAVDPDNEDIFVLVLFCKSIGVAEECEARLWSTYFNGGWSDEYTVVREYKMVIIGHKDLVAAVTD